MGEATDAGIRPIRAYLASLLLLVLAGPLAAFAADRTDAPNPSSILWVGNSFTFYNGGIPAMVKALAEELQPGQGSNLRTGMQAVGGAHLPDHVHRLEKRALDDWDLVVLQGYSDEPINPSKMAAFQNTVNLLTGLIRDGGAAPALFMTWAYKDRPTMTSALAKAYEARGREAGAPVIPVGLAFERVTTARPSLSLYVEGDNKHPSPAGTYLAACVFYSWLFGRSPENASFMPQEVSPHDAALLQRMAWETVLAYSSTTVRPDSAAGG